MALLAGWEADCAENPDVTTRSCSWASSPPGGTLVSRGQAFELLEKSVCKSSGREKGQGRSYLFGGLKDFPAECATGHGVATSAHVLTRCLGAVQADLTSTDCLGGRQRF